ncbi:MAG: CerR family C-terminal domain-containing protein [Pseudomonadota bacterium]
MGGRGEQTRDRLLDHATILFSLKGYDGVSTRDISKAAGTTLPSIAHHFGSKEGLYKAVMSSIMEYMERTLPPDAPLTAAALSTMARAEVLTQLKHTLGRHIRAMLAGRPEWGPLMAREQLQPTLQLAPLEQLFWTRLLYPVCHLLAVLRALPADSDAVKLQALSLVGRVLNFRQARAGTLRFMGWDTVGPAQVEIIVAALDDELSMLFGPR